MSDEKVEDLGFGMDDEFAPNEEPVVTPPVNTAPPEPSKIKIGDKEYTEAEILAKFQQQPAPPPIAPAPQFIPPQFEYEPVPDLTTEELQVIGLGFANDPMGAFNRLAEATFGKPIAVVKRQLDAAQEVETKIYGHAVGVDFVKRHKNDYYACPENGDLMEEAMLASGRYPTPENYDYLFNELKNSGRLIQAPTGQEAADDSESTSLSGNMGYPDPARATSGSNDEDMIEKFKTMPLEQLKEIVRQSRRSG